MKKNQNILELGKNAKNASMILSKISTAQKNNALKELIINIRLFKALL